MANPFKTYDGTTMATLTPSDTSASRFGFVGGQIATYSGATGTYGSANAGSGIAVNATLGTGNFASSGTGFLWSKYTVPTMTLSGTGTIGKATLTAMATTASMPFGGTASWTTSATSLSSAGLYGIAGDVTLGSPYSGDYAIVQAPGNPSALTIMSNHPIPPLGSLFGQTVSLPFSGAPQKSLLLSPAPPTSSSETEAEVRWSPLPQAPFRFRGSAYRGGEHGAVRARF